MRRLTAIVIAMLVPLWVGVLAFAQHGGGHASTGGHSGLAMHGGFAGHSGGRSFSGMHSGAGFSRRPSSPGSFHSPISSRAPLSSRGRFSSRGRTHSGVGLRIRTRDFRNNCFGFACRGAFAYPWPYAGAFDPYWWWDSGSSYDEDREREIGLASEMNAQSLEEQRMREQSDSNASAEPPTPRQQRVERADPGPPTVLIFRDQHQQEVQNYAIVGQTLWIFAAQRTQKIPLAELDVDATQKANDERGVDFRMPGANAGQ